MACSCDGMGKCPQPPRPVAAGVVWAKVARDGGRHRGPFHAWGGGAAICPTARRGNQSKARRDRQPFNACRDCLRILGGIPSWPNSSHRGQTLRRGSSNG